MEKQTSENNDLPIGVKLRSMLMKLSTNESPKTHNVQVHVQPDMTGQNGSNSLKLDEVTTCEEQSELDGESKNPETNQVNKSDDGSGGFPDVVPRWERKRLPPSPFHIHTLRDDDDEDLIIEEIAEDKAALLLSSKECVSQQSQFHLPKSTEGDDGSQTEVKDKISGIKLTRQTPVNVIRRTGRSASDPDGPHVTQRPNEPRPCSAPDVSNLKEYEKIPIEGAMQDSISPKGRKDSGEEESFWKGEHEVSTIQTEGMKSKVKTFTQKMVEMLKDKPHRGSKSSLEEESTSSMEMEVEALLSPPPLPPKRARYVYLQRTFTLKDFELNLEPINLMEEIFTGEEWLPYLPSKTSAPQKDSLGTCHVPQITSKQDQTGPSHDCKSHVKQDIIDEDDDTPSDLNTIRKDKRHVHVKQVELNKGIFAIPKSLLTNAAQQPRQRKISSESKTSDDVYDCKDMFIIPKYDLLSIGRRSGDVYLDILEVKSLELLDNSALKGRIRLSEKRLHRPPKKYRKENGLGMNSKFYNVPS